MAEQNLDWFKTPSFSLLAASPRSGKSYLIEFMLKKLWSEGRFSYGFVFSTTAKMNGDYNYLPQKFIYEAYDDDILLRIMAHQKSKGGPRAPPAFLILDDCMGDANFKSKVFTKFTGGYRHYNLTVFIAVQYINQIPQTIKNCTTYAFFFKQKSLQSITALWKAFVSTFYDKVKKWQEDLEKYTRNYWVLILDMDAEGAKEQCFLRIRAPANLPQIQINY